MIPRIVSALVLLLLLHMQLKRRVPGEELYANDLRPERR